MVGAAHPIAVALFSGPWCLCGEKSLDSRVRGNDKDESMSIRVNPCLGDLNLRKSA